MKSFRHVTPEARIYGGADCLKHLTGELKRGGHERVLVFCDPFLEDGPLLQLVRDAIGERLSGIFNGIAPGSPVPEVKKGAEAIREKNADAIVVIGGGSSVVTARASIILAAEQRDPHDICTTRAADGSMQSPKLLAPKIPMFVVPTTPITAMVKAGASILDPDSDTLLALFDPKTRGKAIFIHPAFVESMPMPLLMSACMSTLAAAIDGLLSTDGDPLSDALLIHATRMLYENLADKNQLTDPDIRCALMLATVLCGMGSDYTGFGISVVMGHAVTAHYRVNAGFVNGVIVPHTLEYNRTAENGMKKIALAFGIPAEGNYIQNTIDRTNALLSSLDIPHTLREMDVPDDGFEKIAASAMDDWYLHFNPIPVEKEDLVQLLKRAW